MIVGRCTAIITLPKKVSPTEKKLRTAALDAGAPMRHPRRGF